MGTTALLGVEGEAHLFACRALDPVQVQGHAVNVLGAARLGSEVIQARLVAADELHALRTRFPQQLQQVYARLPAVAPSELQPVKIFAPATPFRQAEVARVRHTQQWPIGPLAGLGNLLGEFWFYLLAMPVLWLAFGMRPARLMLMALMLVTVLVQAVKAQVAIPRPFSYDPSLSLVGAAGSAMPSGHTASATAFCLLVALWLAGRQGGGPLRQAIHAGIGLLAGLLAGLARVWLGVHYWSDVAVGLLLGVLVAMMVLALAGALARRPQPERLERSCWGLLAAISLAAGLYWSAAPMLLPLGVATACALVPRLRQAPTSWRSAALLLAGLLVLAAVFLPAAQRAEPYAISVVLLVLVYAALGAWIAWGAGALARWRHGRSAK